jgi:hypothetical protein
MWQEGSGLLKQWVISGSDHPWESATDYSNDEDRFHVHSSAHRHVVIGPKKGHKQGIIWTVCHRGLLGPRRPLESVLEPSTPFSVERYPSRLIMG